MLEFDKHKACLCDLKMINKTETCTQVRNENFMFSVKH
jgi:hypothetical protein